MRENIWLILLLVALLLAMLLTLLAGGNRSRHGYGSRWAPAQGSPLSTGRPSIRQAQMPPQRLYTSG